MNSVIQFLFVTEITIFLISFPPRFCSSVVRTFAGATFGHLLILVHDGSTQ